MFMHRLKHDVLAFLLLLLLLPALVRSQVDRSTGNRLKMTDSDQAFYKVIVDCSLFRPLGWRPPDTRPKYQLMATKIPAQGPAKAMIKESRSSQIYYLGVGDKLQLTKVEKIETNQVSLNLEGKLIALKLNNLQFLSTGGEKRGRDEKTEERAKYRSGKEQRRGGDKNKGKSGEITPAEAKEISRRWENASAKEKGQMIRQFRQLDRGEQKRIMRAFPSVDFSQFFK